MSASLAAIVTGCAVSPSATGFDDPTSTAQNTADSTSPCNQSDSNVILCADFDEPPSLGWAATQMGGGEVTASNNNSVSKPYSLHVKTVSGSYAAAAYVINQTAITAGSVSIDVDLMILPTSTDSTDATNVTSSLLRVDLGGEADGDQSSVGGFYLHYDLASKDLQLIGVDGWGPVGSNSLGPAPEGWFHLQMTITPAKGGGSYAQAQVGNSAATVTIDGAAATAYSYTFEAGLNVPAADNYEAYLDNVVVRKAAGTMSTSSGSSNP